MRYPERVAARAREADRGADRADVQVIPRAHGDGLRRSECAVWQATIWAEEGEDGAWPVVSQSRRDAPSHRSCQTMQSQPLLAVSYRDGASPGS